MTLGELLRRLGELAYQAPLDTPVNMVVGGDGAEHRGAVTNVRFDLGDILLEDV